MRIRLSLVVFVMSLFAVAWLISVSLGYAAGEKPRDEDVAKAIIAREKASAEAWQRKDKNFFVNFLSDDATYFGVMSPYLEINPKENFLPKFEQHAEQFKLLDFQMYNPRVQLYGDTAILTYNSMTTANFAGRPMNYSAKMTSVYVRQGDTWRVVHGHESMNPGAQ